MKISVVIPCYNSEETLPDQLEALANQRFEGPWEVILADNGSTDRSVEIGRGFRDRLELVEVDARGKRGAAHARNEGVKVAKSDFVAFCDADDVVGEGYLEAVYRGLERFPFIAGRYEYEKLNRRWISRLPGVQQEDVDRGLFGSLAYAGGGSLAIRKEVHDEIGGFDEENFPILQDTDYCIRVQKSGVALRFWPEAVIHYRWRESVRAAFNQARRWGYDVVFLRRRYWPVGRRSDAWREFFHHFREAVRIRNRRHLAHWIWALGWRVGTVEGWREVAKTEVKEPRSFRNRVSAIVGRLLRFSGGFRARACGVANRFGFGGIDRTVHLEHPVKVDGREDIYLGPRVWVGFGSWLYAVSRYREQVFSPKIEVGEDVRIGRFSHIVATGKILVGKGVEIGERVYLSDNLHDYRDPSRPVAENPLIGGGGLVIGDGCRIGEGACVIGSVEMGAGSVLEANSVLTRSLPANSYAAGVPARVVRSFGEVPAGSVSEGENKPGSVG